MKYKVGDKAKIVDSTREEDNIIGFETGDEVTITKCFNKEQRYEITKNGVSGYIDECNLTDLSSYTWEDFLKAPIGTKITFEKENVLVKYCNDGFADYSRCRKYNAWKGFKDIDICLGKIVKIEEPKYVTVYEPKEVTMPEIEEMKRLTDELFKTCDEFIKKIKEK